MATGKIWSNQSGSMKKQRRRRGTNFKLEQSANTYNTNANSTNTNNTNM